MKERSAESFHKVLSRVAIATLRSRRPLVEYEPSKLGSASGRDVDATQASVPDETSVVPSETPAEVEWIKVEGKKKWMTHSRRQMKRSKRKSGEDHPNEFGTCNRRI